MPDRRWDVPIFLKGVLRVSDGTRTRDRLDHNQELYQLSYAHQVRQRSLAARQG